MLKLKKYSPESDKTETLLESEKTKAPTESVKNSNYTAPKGRPTPSRKQQVAARKQPLVITDRKAAKNAEREARREQQIREQQALRTGDEKNLPLKDRGPQRRFIRDFIDARFNVGDYMMIVLFILLILGWIIPGAQLQFTMAMWVLLLIFAIDLWFMWRGLKKRLISKFGQLDGGLTMYAVNRAMMIRPLRLPKPQVKRGQYPN